MSAVRLLLAAIVAAVVVVSALLVPSVLGDDDDPADVIAVMGPANGEPGGGTSANLSAVETFDTGVPSHVDGDVDYEQSPPVGGEHDGMWLECGVYDREVRKENMVHALEHGTVWITYRPGLDQDDIDNLAGALPDEGVLSPYPDQEATVVVTVWNTQLALDGPDDPRLPLFVDRYGHGETAPEPMASCHGGVEAYDAGVNA